jgi:DNA-directed RNA polymerase subunit RPC12/RpoP
LKTRENDEASGEARDAAKRRLDQALIKSRPSFDQVSTKSRPSPDPAATGRQIHASRSGGIVAAMKFSTSDLTILRIRCAKCSQHTEKSVTVLVRKDAIQCANCGGRISLSTPTNKILIVETAESCARVGDALMKGLALD